MSTEDLFTLTSRQYLIRDRGMDTIKKNRRLLSIVEEGSDVYIRVKTQTQLGIYQLILNDLSNNIAVKIRQLRFRFHPVFTVLLACGNEIYHQVGTIKRQSARSELHHYTINSIYGHYDLVQVNEQEFSYFLTKNEHLIAHCNKNLHVSIDVKIENEEYRQFILALFVLALGR